MASPTQLNFNLQKLLEQLNFEELSKFKSLMKAYALQNELKQIPQGKMQEANARQLTEILTNCCPKFWVETVSLQVFKKLNRTDLCEKAKKELHRANLKSAHQAGPPLLVIKWTLEPRCPTMERTLQQLREEKPENKYRRVIKKKIEQIWKNNFWPEDSENVYIAMQRYQTLIPFCNPKTSAESFAHTVVLHGPSGSGKTTLAKKLILDWTQFNLGQFQCAFYLSCRELNYSTPCTFAELISKDCPELQEDILAAIAQAERVLFVVDGFDELSVPSGALIRDICGDWKVPKQVPILLSSLLKRKMVPKATLLVTTQPRALRDLLLLVEQPHFVEVEGFSEQDRKEYFWRHFEDEDQARRAFDAMRCNATLYHMGSAPAVCRLVCACLKLQMQRGQDPALGCQTTTSLFLQFLCGQFTPAPGGCAQGHLRVPLEALCLLAAWGLWTQQLSVFDRGDLGRLKVTESHLHPFLDKQILQRDKDCTDCFSFVHLSVQQFLAAVFYILKRQEQEKEDSLRWDTEDIGDVRTLLSKEARARNPSLTQAGHFLFGLLNKKRAQELEATFGCQTSLEVQEELLKCGAEETKPFLLKMDPREVFYCLYESREEELVKDAMAPFEEISLQLKSSTDILHSVFCLKHCGNLQRLSLQVAKSLFLDEDAVLDSYIPGVRSQDYQNLLPLWTDLCSMFCSNKNLIFLDISRSFLSTSSVRILCEQIASAVCKFQKVVLKNICPASAYQNLCFTLRGYETLTHLILQVGDHNDVFPSLHEVLRHPKCHLQYLRLGPGSATTQQWADFFLALQANQSLTCLDLSDNELMDEGIKLLCETLRHPKCFLQKLSLENCHLTEACCKDLTSVLIVNQSLTHLCLAKNDLGDGGVKILCDGLGYPECKLQTLVLWLCSVTAAGCSCLSKVLRSESSLTHLDLGLNHIGIRGVRSLCEALKEPLCNLTHLGLWGCAITPLSSKELSSALSKNRSLIALDLGQNSLGFDGVKMMYEALKSQTGPLKTLRLKIDEYDANIQKLLQEIKEVNPQLTIDSDHRNPRNRRPSSYDFVF